MSYHYPRITHSIPIKSRTSGPCTLSTCDLSVWSQICSVTSKSYNYSQSYGFYNSHVWMWELDHKEGWVPKNWCFWTVVLEKTLKSLLGTARRSNQSILKEMNSEYSLEGLLLKLKFQYFDHLMHRADSLEKALILGKTEGKRRRDSRGRDGWIELLTQ